MDSLPRELIELILLWNVRMCECEKNSIFPLRLVCKAFDIALKPYIFKTIQLEFSKFLRAVPTPDMRALESVGNLCQAVYLDMMVVRDEDEITRLTEVFNGIIVKVPEMGPLLLSLRRYCMNENTFDETDFRRVIERVLAATPNMTRLKLNLPFQVVGRTSSTATLLLATTFACVAGRPADEYKPLETMVLDHVSDTTLSSICNNPIDLNNALATFAGLKHLVLSLKRQEARLDRQGTFTVQLWFLIRKALNLESLCIIGWNVKRDINVRLHRHSMAFNDWSMRSLPYHIDPKPVPRTLRYLELKRVDINPRSLLGLIEDNSKTLKEVYLNEVYLKVFGSSEQANTPLWIGYPDESRPEQALWLAESLRNMENLRLDVLRATGLGYDDFDPDTQSAHPRYDLPDPSGLNRSFDQRFVEAVLGHDDITTTNIIAPTSHDGYDTHNHPLSGASDARNSETSLQSKRANDYDVETYQRHHNTTSHYKHSIDGYFLNHNEQALKELQRIINLADRGMTLISEEIVRNNTARIVTDIGDLGMEPAAPDLDPAP